MNEAGVIDRIECAARVEGEPLITFVVNEAQVELLAAGVVPREVRANCLGVLRLADEDERNAARPEPRKKRKKP
jgi:hypothetical protein